MVLVGHGHGMAWPCRGVPWLDMAQRGTACHDHAMLWPWHARPPPAQQARMQQRPPPAGAMKAPHLGQRHGEVGHDLALLVQVAVPACR